MDEPVAIYHQNLTIMLGDNDPTTQPLLWAKTEADEQKHLNGLTCMKPACNSLLNSKVSRPPSRLVVSFDSLYWL